ncbi:unnamed protein product, partial [Nesidiocoris tenuis]
MEFCLETRICTRLEDAGSGDDSAERRLQENSAEQRPQDVCKTAQRLQDGATEWGGPIGCMVSFVFQFCYNTFMSILKFAFSIFWREPRRQVTDPVGDVLKFIDTVNENYSRNHPVFYQGSYGQALNDAKQELRISRSLTQRIRREQDAAYLESLRVDQEKERRKNEEQEKKMQALREQEEREQAERDRKE